MKFRYLPAAVAFLGVWMLACGSGEETVENDLNEAELLKKDQSRVKTKGKRKNRKKGRADAFEADCWTTGRTLNGNKGERVLIDCPSGCDKSGGFIWGTDTYTPDSKVCVAAIHAGTLKARGGQMTVVFKGRQGTFKGSVKKGLKSYDWHSGYDASFSTKAPGASKGKGKGKSKGKSKGKGKGKGKR